MLTKIAGERKRDRARRRSVGLDLGGVGWCGLSLEHRRWIKAVEQEVGYRQVRRQAASARFGLQSPLDRRQVLLDRFPLVEQPPRLCRQAVREQEKIGDGATQMDVRI